MTPLRLALSTLLHRPGRTIVSVVGTAFAVVLVFMQMGFLGAVRNTATLLYDKLDFDVLIKSSEYIDLSRPGTVDRNLLPKAKGVPGVRDVLPVWLGTAMWRNPTRGEPKSGTLWQITVLGVEPGLLDRTFRPPGRGGIFATPEEQAEKQAALSQLDYVLLDELSRPDFGGKNLVDDTEVDLNSRRVRLGGYFRAGTGFSYTGLLLTNEQTFRDYLGSSESKATFGLVTLEPGTDPASAVDALNEMFDGDAKAIARDDLALQEQTYWVNRTAVGQFFNFGVLLALTVGAIFIYQMMVADIKKHLPEYATLKAMGYRFGFLFSTVVWQALLLALAGFALGLAISLPLYDVAKSSAGLPIGMTLERIGYVLLLTVAMCVLSGVLAVRKAQEADPADLF